MTGIEAFLEILHRAGVAHIFGNPGTTELPLNDALGRDPRFRYILGLHEIPVMAAADGFAQASGRVAVVNLHTACGLGNAMGMLYNARVSGTPLVVTAGQQDARLRFDEPVLAAPLVEMAQPLVKWSAQVDRVEDVPNATRRAIQIALAPPTGPVFLALPLDVQRAETTGLDLSGPWIPDRHIRPAADALNRAAEILSKAANPVILAGSRVTESGGIAELVAVAESLGAPVFTECGAASGRLPFPTDHPLLRGPLPLWSPDVRNALQPFDVAFAVGLNVLKLYIHQEPVRPLPDHLKLVHLDSAPAEIGKNFPVEAGLLGDPKAGLAELAALIPPRPDAKARIAMWAAQRAAEQSSLRAKVDSLRSACPMSSLVMMDTLASVLPTDVAVVQEAPTAHHNHFERLGALKDPAGWFAHRAWALGWGAGCALGVKLAWPQRPVLALLGDGASLYGIQALWTAARERIPIVFVIANNGRYRILEHCGEVMKLPGLAAAPGMKLGDVDFVGLSHSLGVEAHRITEPDDLAARVRAAFTSDQPMLFDVPISD
ncbi:MAG: thiamine pyrophosphate-binding protein [Gemmataceae bacterium]